MESKENKKGSLLVKNAEDGSLETIRLLVEEEKININARDDSGFTALHKAASYGHKEVVEYLLTNGSDVNATVHPINNPSTPLFLSVSGGYTDIAKILIQYGAEVDITCKGITLLDNAVRSNNPATLDLLLEHGFNIDDYNDKGYTPLSLALYSGRYDNADFLLKKGADHRKCCIDKRYSPLHYTVRSVCSTINSGPLIKLLLKHVKEREGEVGVLEYINYNNTIEGYTALHKACRLRDYNATKILLEQGANINIKDIEGHVPEDLLSKFDNSQVCIQIRLLIQSENK